jgi:hypothetical protein
MSMLWDHSVCILRVGAVVYETTAVSTIGASPTAASGLGRTDLLQALGLTVCTATAVNRSFILKQSLQEQSLFR